jgi:YaiO family outer membrane protein
MNRTIIAIVLTCFMSLSIAHAEGYKEKMARARELRLTGHTEEALVLYDEILEQSHRDVDALVGRGYCYVRNSDHIDKALADFEKVIVLVPTYVDAYVGAAIVHRRKGDWDKAEAAFLQCEEACADNAKRKRYLATAAWQEGQFRIARRLDKEYPPEPERVLTKEPTRVSVNVGHYWLERGEDWDVTGVSVSHRVRPDVSVSASFKGWMRYGDSDSVGSLGASYRHTSRSSISYKTRFSDSSGFLVDRSHRVMAKYDLFKRTKVGLGASASKYSVNWSEKVQFQIKQKLDNFHVGYKLSTGRDTKDQDVSSHSFEAGYRRDQLYSLTASYRWGDETVEVESGDDFEFRTDDVETARISVGYYINDLTSLNAGYMHEWRNSDLYRRGVTLSASRRF